MAVTSLKALSPNIVTLGVLVSTHEFGVGVDTVQLITDLMTFTPQT